MKGIILQPDDQLLEGRGLSQVGLQGEKMSVQVFITKVVPSSLLATARTVVMNVTNLVM